MNLIFEQSRPGRKNTLLPPCDTPEMGLSPELARRIPLRLPEVAEGDLSRHYSDLAGRAFGVNNGFYPLGSCTMKYNPKINEEAAGLFTKLHPLQPERSVQGCLEVLERLESYLCEITGMDAMTLQPAAGAHGELTGLLLIKAYHRARGDHRRTRILVPDSAHGTNPASAAMAQLDVVSIPSAADGCVDLEKLRAAAGEDTAGLMLTNPNTLGLFDKNILQITEIVHKAGGLNYYDGANLNAVMGIARPGDMGFDVVHLNLHKTFSAPHGGGGPGSGPVGCKKDLEPYLPVPRVVQKADGMLAWSAETKESIGRVKMFYGHFLVAVRALAYILTLGQQGIPEAAQNAVLNANYLKHLLKDHYDMASEGPCMHEFVMTLAGLKKEKNVSALDLAKSLLDEGMHPPTMYFPLIVHEALMVEPTETESKETLEEAAAVFIRLLQTASQDPEKLRSAPLTTPVRRLDEVGAARNPRLRYLFAHQKI